MNINHILVNQNNVYVLSGKGQSDNLLHKGVISSSVVFVVRGCGNRVQSIAWLSRLTVESQKPNNGFDNSCAIRDVGMIRSSLLYYTSRVLYPGPGFLSSATWP